MKQMKAHFVGGAFDENWGHPSGYITQLFSELKMAGFQCKNYLNGGHINTLHLLPEMARQFDTIIWFADVDNKYPKLVEEIKKQNPHCLLVTSKRNDDDKYDFKELISRALKTKSNLIVEFKKSGNLVNATIFDPLGNVFLKDCDEPKLVARALYKRIGELSSFTRVESVRIGSIPDNLKLSVNEELACFYNVVQKYAETYHNLIHGANTERMLGNVSFRCENGFPSFRNPAYPGMIYVSKRNIDKREINSEGFVPVILTDGPSVYYFGDNKPSVDAPIQVRLYNYYQNVNFILHSHVYIGEENWLWPRKTSRIIPCGAIEEFDEITKMFGSDMKNIRVNLKGHGSLVLAEKIDFLENISYVARNLPEIVE